MELPDFVLAWGGTAIVGILGGVIASTRGKIVKFIKAVSELLDIVAVVMDSVEDGKITADEIRKIKVEIHEFRDEVENLLGNK